MVSYIKVELWYSDLNLETLQKTITVKKSYKSFFIIRKLVMKTKLDATVTG